MTFLFTDVEGSTRRWESDPVAMQAALAAHDKCLRTAIEAHEGFLFSHSGDGVAAAFASPTAAVEAAVDAQRELKLPVRMGIATGEAELRDGDYFGTVLNRAARVMAAGHGGQILVAESTAVLLGNIELLNLGQRRLRDVSAPITLHQVQAAGLRDQFPPLRTEDADVGNLRAPSTSLIGRESEVAGVETALRQHRLLTLTGVGGVGKTRVALEVAAHLVGEFPDGVWVLELANVTDPRAVPDAVAAVLGVGPQAGKTVGESLADALDGRVQLLVFDNCEHVVDAVADLVERILTRTPTVKILATSREGLGLADERLWRLPSLEVASAMALFEERSQISLTDESAAVEEICVRLDGIPLAIELAAARMASMTATEVRDRLDHRFKLLVGARRGLERHQTLRHAVSWSFDLLDEAEKRLLARCSVFAGGFDLQSACAVAEPDQTDDYVVLDRLGALVRKSLLVADRSAGRTRYSMLETIRQFAEEQLVTCGAAEEVRALHAGYFAGCEDAVMALWDSPRQREAYGWFTTEFANLRIAFRWAADHGDLDVAAALATYAGLVGFLAENYEPISWAEELIEAARAVDHPRLQYLCQIASVCYMSGRVEAALDYIGTIEVAIRNGRDAVPFGLAGLAGGAYLTTGRPERAVEWCRTYLERGRGKQALNRAALVNSLAMVGRHEEAIAAGVGLISAAHATGNPWVLSYAYLGCGLAYRPSDPVRALELLRSGLDVARDSANRFNESHLAHLLAGLEVEYGDPAAALDHMTFALRNYQNAGSVAFYHPPLASLAMLLERLGQREPAATLAGFAALSQMTLALYPELTDLIIRLRDALGHEAFELLAERAAAMTTSAIATYAYEQIENARAQLQQLR
ncbi:cyclase [Mycolicibacterium novocastrense]|nr:cyclase [Mycolicibacterium novocastrense]KUH65974.1 cyclase [Mycolicibacterium novocastrense]KUH67214.1 cyclase [Mycolicibacterium novocastrense]